MQYLVVDYRVRHNVTICKPETQMPNPKHSMRAAVFAQAGVLEIQDRRVPQITHADEVLIEVEGCGLCGTDLHILATPPGHPATTGTILGHEFVGRIAELGSDVTAFEVGLRVVVDPNLKCGVCRFCRRGLANHCENWTTLGIFQDGGFAQYAVAPQRALHPISETVPFEDAVWTEILSCVLASTDRMAIGPGRTAVVIGAGPVGVLHGMLFQAAGARVIIADRAPLRLDLARGAGIERTVHVDQESLMDAVQESTDGTGADVVVDAVGNQFQTCLNVVGKQGFVSLFGMNAAASPSVTQADITRNEVTVFGSFVGQHAFPRAIQLLESGAVLPSALVTHRLTVDELLQGIEAARRGEAMKVVITP